MTIDGYTIPLTFTWKVDCARDLSGVWWICHAGGWHLIVERSRTYANRYDLWFITRDALTDLETVEVHEREIQYIWEAKEVGEAMALQYLIDQALSITEDPNVSSVADGMELAMKLNSVRYGMRSDDGR